MSEDHRGHLTALAAGKARGVLSSLMLKHPCEMEIEDIAWSLGLIVKEVDLEGCDGRLVRNSDRGIISINRNVLELGRKRLTVAHEIGHFILHKETRPIESYSESLLFNYGLQREEELEANVFAAELLMPSELLQPKCQAEASLDLIRDIANEFQVTLTAAAMRYVEFTKSQCALVFSKDGKIQWYKKSESFAYPVYPGTLLTPGSYARDLFEGKPPQKKKEQVFAKDWFTGPKINDNAPLWEESIFFQRYNSVLSLLSIEQELWLEKSDYW